ncbi:MAG: hypothetical protein K2X87_33915 [Gemmataceae bacterium]|nr:hypothetical protein [Gemmataceae bacterium]
MLELVYRFDPTGRHTPDPPADPAEARRRLEDGNRAFSTDPLAAGPTRRVLHVDADDLGLPTEDGKAPTQRPFAAVLACSDARAPVEVVFGQGCNRLFVVRVAGNVLGSECLGSLDFAVTNFDESLRLVVVLGHSRCGAVSAAVDSFLNPSQYLAYAPSHPLRAVVDRLMVPVRAAHQAVGRAWGHGIGDRPGYRDALIGTAVGLNAALTAATVRQELREHLGPAREVVYGVYDLVTRRVGVPIGVPGESRFAPGLVPPPADLTGFDQLGIAIATSPPVRDLLA